MAITDKLTAIANAIRAANGTTAPLNLDEMAEAIAALPRLGQVYTIEQYDDDGNLIYAEMHGQPVVRQHAFNGTTYLAHLILPETATKIENNMVFQSSKIETLRIPASVKTVGRYTALQCSALHTITFAGTPDSIHAQAFQQNPKLTTINVPWAEGEVADAPWGATAATINYNYTGGVDV